MKSRNLTGIIAFFFWTHAGYGAEPVSLDQATALIQVSELEAAGKVAQIDGRIIDAYVIYAEAISIENQFGIYCGEQNFKCYELLRITDQITWKDTNPVVDYLKDADVSLKDKRFFLSEIRRMVIDDNFNLPNVLNVKLSGNLIEFLKRQELTIEKRLSFIDFVEEQIESFHEYSER